MAGQIKLPVLWTMVVVIWCASLPTAVAASTIWASSGTSNLTGGSLVAQNSDQAPQGSQLKVFITTSGHPFLGLYHEKHLKNFPLAGINDRGLAMVSIQAAIPPRDRRILAGRNLNEKILTRYDSVDAVVADRELFGSSLPMFYIIADRTKTAVIEVALGGDLSVRVEENGTLCHTGHYVDHRMARHNQTAGKASQTRMERVRALLRERTAPHTMESFIAISENRQDGPNESIFSTGSAIVKDQTISTIVFFLPPDGPPSVFLRLTDKAGEPRNTSVVVDEKLWTTRSRTIFF